MVFLIVVLINNGSVLERDSSIVSAIAQYSTNISINTFYPSKNKKQMMICATIANSAIIYMGLNLVTQTINRDTGQQ
jgi:hypothetical protein